MPLETEPRIVWLHPDAVVFDADELLAAVLDRHRHARRAGVDGVFDQLLDDRGRTLDDLTSGNLVGKVVGQPLNAAHKTEAEGHEGR